MNKNTGKYKKMSFRETTPVEFLAMTENFYLVSILLETFCHCEEE